MDIFIFLNNNNCVSSKVEISSYENEKSCGTQIYCCISSPISQVADPHRLSDEAFKEKHKREGWRRDCGIDTRGACVLVNDHKHVRIKQISKIQLIDEKVYLWMFYGPNMPLSPCNTIKIF